MAVPKKRVSLSRRRLRRANYKVHSHARGTCTNCKSFVLNYNACHVCGYYKGKKYINVD